MRRVQAGCQRLEFEDGNVFVFPRSQPIEVGRLFPLNGRPANGYRRAPAPRW
ncbi:hypothetical protein [Streptomyces sp. NPDC053079]|uniref:hypothetical protein n=1 Tax=Streptomyces sp. NPDC053079 TaxID=3365697 RepID=UPI0037CF9970